MKQLLLLLLLLPSFLFSNIVWFISNTDTETFGRITGRTNEGQDVDMFISAYNGRYVELDKGHYFLHVRHPAIKGGQSFSGVFTEYVVKDKQKDRMLTKVVTMLYPASTFEFYVKNDEERVKIDIPMKQKFIEERIIDDQSSDALDVRLKNGG